MGIFSRNLLLIFGTAFLFFFSFHMLLPILALFAKNIGASDAEIGLIIGIFAFMAVIARLPVGIYVDRHGKKRMIILGCLIFFISPILYSICSTPSQLFFIRMFHGIGIAAFTISAMAMVADLAPRGRLGEIMGFYGVSVMFATAVAPSLGGLLTDLLDFSRTFLIASLLAFSSVILSTLIKEQIVQSGSYSYKTSFKDAITNKNVITSSLAIFTLTITYASIVSFFPVYARLFNITPTEVGLFFTAYAVATIFTRPTMGRLSDRFGRAPVILPTMCLAAIAIFLVSKFSTLNGFFISAVLYGVGFGSAFSALSAFVVDTIDPKNRGSAMGIFTSCFDLGIATGSIGLGVVGQYYGYQVLYETASLILVIGVVSFIIFRYIWKD
ncbi:MAG: MFS transporter [Euryarchaeota archaeon]|nr:MFS transporter [Euryarchaeota archaeon]